MDAAAFEALFDRHRRELHVHAYRMLGSIHDAEDAVQEAFLRAWRGIGTFEGRSSIRRWLYRIATTACLDELERRPRRVLPNAIASPADPTQPPAPPAELPWLTPYPDALLPEDAVIGKESIRLAFVAAMQQLPPRQRAALILRDVLSWSAKETASALGTTVAATNSILQRARATMSEQHLPNDETSVEERALVERYVDAWERADVPALVALLSEDARMTMPPTPSWYDGRSSIGTYLAEFVFSDRGPGPLRLVTTRANMQPALAVYQVEDGVPRPFALKVLAVRGGAIAEITGFVDPSLFPIFGLTDEFSLLAAS
jgi:RNA polymerase sigma-70 factor (ECF subfamily)